MLKTNRIYHGDALNILQTFPSECVQTIITSPPYWGLRNYENHQNQLGQEEYLEQYISNLLNVFTEAKRVLMPNGLFWLNLGDTYIKKEYSIQNVKAMTSRIIKTNKGAHCQRKPCKTKQNLVSTNLAGVPWRVALALQDNGWILRQDIIWNKINALPESVTSRCSKSHEYIFMFAKKQKYYFDYKSIQEVSNSIYGNPYEKVRKRSVWSTPKSDYKGEHYAAFTEQLITPCILSSSKENDVVLDVFSGAGTTAVVAKKYRRRYIGIELNKKYVDLSNQRLRNTLTNLI